MAGLFGLGQKMLERDVTRQAQKANPGFSSQLQKMRMTGAPIPSLAQMFGFGIGQTAQRKATPDKVLAGITGAKQAAGVTPKLQPQAGKKFSFADLFGMRRG